MNILFICSAKSWGGNEKWTYMAMQGLAVNHQVYFLGKNPDLLSKFGDVSASYIAPFTWNFDFRSKRIITRIVKDKHIDVIISTKKKEYFLAGLVAKRLNIKHFIRLGIMRKMGYPYWSKLVYQTLNDGIIVNAKQIKSSLLKYRYFSHHPIQVIYNGIPDMAYAYHPLLKSGKFNIVSVGMLTKRKGFHIMIEAISLLSDSIKNDIQFIVVGEGREEMKLKEKVSRLGLEGIVIFKGFAECPAKYLQTAHLFALLSGNEGISNAVIEAMYMGVPVLTTNAGGMAEVIVNGENGFLTPRDVKQVAIRLQEIYTVKRNNLVAIGQNGQTTARSFFNLKTMNNQLSSFILKT